MRKIPTIFDRDWEGNKGVIDALGEDIRLDEFIGAIWTEKLDGTNVRLTVRNHSLVRLEKRRNPSKSQKADGIVGPWYVDAVRDDPADKHIWAAAENTNLDRIFDGDWEGEAVGPKIQGNPLNLEEKEVVLFSLQRVRGNLMIRNPGFVFDQSTHVCDVYEFLKGWLPKQRSIYGINAPMEGIVWWDCDGEEEWEFPLGKIKAKDFK